eukprot:4031840-Prymnesium_polylepis.1
MDSWNSLCVVCWPPINPRCQSGCHGRLCGVEVRWPAGKSGPWPRRGTETDGHGGGLCDTETGARGGRLLSSDKAVHGGRCMHVCCVVSYVCECASIVVEWPYPSALAKKGYGTSKVTFLAPPSPN